MPKGGHQEFARKRLTAEIKPVHTKSNTFLKLAVAQVAAGSLCAMAVRWFRGPSMSLLDCIVFVAGFIVAGLAVVQLHERRRLPAPLLGALDKLNASIRGASVKGLMRGVWRLIVTYSTLIACAILVVVLQRYAPAIETLPDGARGVYNAATLVGVLGLVLGALRGIVGTAEEPAVVGITLIERFVLLAMGLTLVRVFGEDVAAALAWVKGNPDAALAAGAGIVVVRMMFALAPNRTYLVARGAEGRLLSAQAVAMPKRARSEKDIYRTAVHEAAHLMLYADLPELPAKLTVNVMGELGHQDLYRGYVRHSDEHVPDVLTEEYLRWLMLMNLAGSEGEFAILGDRADGAVGDNQMWLKAATFYLSAGFGEVFYAEPVGHAQLAHNRAVLNSLKAQHVAVLADRIAANKGLLGELASAIAAKKAMTRDEIAPYLARVV